MLWTKQIIDNTSATTVVETEFTHMVLFHLKRPVLFCTEQSGKSSSAKTARITATLSAVMIFPGGQPGTNLTLMKTGVDSSTWANCAIKYLMLEIINKLINNHYVYMQIYRYLHKDTKYASRPR